MALDRGRLAKIDRRIFAELDHSRGVQMVKVPVSDAVWSTWRRYCEAIGLSMGEGVAGLIVGELRSTIDENDNRSAYYAEQLLRQAQQRSKSLDARQRDLDQLAERLRARQTQLAAWARELATRPSPTVQAGTVGKVGRNDRCPCGSGLKYKHCHGLPGRSE